MMIKDTNYYVTKLRQAGLMLVNRATELIGDSSMVTGYRFLISLNPDSAPTIQVEREIAVGHPGENIT